MLRAAFKGLSLSVLFSTAFKGLSLFVLLSEKLSTVVPYCFQAASSASATAHPALLFSSCEQCKRNSTPSPFLSSFLISFFLTTIFYWGISSKHRPLAVSLWSWICTTRESLKLRFEQVYLARFVLAFPATPSGQSTPKLRPSLLYSRTNTAIHVCYNVEVW